MARTGVALALSLGFAVPAHAGAITSDFTANTLDNPVGDAIGGSEYVQVTGVLNATSSGVMIFNLGTAFDPYNLNIEAFRTTTTATTATRLRRTTNETTANNLYRLGLGVCSASDSLGNCPRSSIEAPAVDGRDNDELIKFSIDEANDFMFAVRYVTFGDVGFIAASGDPDPLNPSNDNAILSFAGGSFSFNVQTVGLCADDPVVPGAGDPKSDICTVDVYKMVGLSDEGVGDFVDDEGLIYDPLNVDYSLGLDPIFDVLASDYFTFSATGHEDDWFIRSAEWVVADDLRVVADDLPEPASMTLLGAGLLGLGYFGKRRRA